MAKVDPIQTAALAYAHEVVSKSRQPSLAEEYKRTTTLATDSCSRYEAFSSRTKDWGITAHLLYIHALEFGCEDLSRHASDVVGMAKISLGIK